MTEVIDRSENVVNTYRYSPFGEPLEKNETVFNPYQFTGRRYDEESGQFYYRARQYSAEQARFLSQDPAKEGANLYAYVGNNPINYRDPIGLDKLSTCYSICAGPGCAGLCGAAGASLGITTAGIGAIFGVGCWCLCVFWMYHCL